MADEKKKLIGIYDPSAFVRADGSLDTDPLLMPSGREFKRR